MAENFLNLRRVMYIHICEFQVPMDPNRLNPDQATFRYVIIKLSKVKDRKNFKFNKRKYRSYI